MKEQKLTEIRKAPMQGATGLVPVRSDSAGSSARKGWKWLLVASGLGLLVLIFGAALIGLRGAAPAIPVEILAEGPVTRILAVSGRIETDAQANVVATAAGKVIEISVEEGDRVTAGQVVAQIDPARQTAAVRQAEAGLASAMVARDEAEDVFRRAMALGQNVSPVTLSEAERRVAASVAEVERQQAIVDQSRLVLEDYTLRAPIAGTVLSSAVEPGQTVAQGTSLMEIADLGRAYVATNVDEAYAAHLRVGMDADVTLAGDTRVVSGHVTFIGAEVDTVTGSLTARIGLDAAADRPLGLTAVVNIIVDRVDRALTVPRTALVRAGSSPSVFLIRDGQVAEVPITFDDWPAERVRVKGGLTAGDVLILDPAQLSPSQPVTALQRDGGER
jgi:HlyD family secretion protein